MLPFANVFPSIILFQWRTKVRSKADSMSIFVNIFRCFRDVITLNCQCYNIKAFLHTDIHNRDMEWNSKKLLEMCKLMKHSWKAADRDIKASEKWWKAENKIFSFLKFLKLTTCLTIKKLNNVLLFSITADLFN